MLVIAALCSCRSISLSYSTRKPSCPNGELIRIKIVQLVYAFYQNEGRTIDVADKELTFSLSKAYDLYNHLLLLLVELRHVAEMKAESKAARAKRLHIEQDAEDLLDAHLAANRLLVQLDENKQLLEFREKRNKDWDDEDAFIKKLYAQVLESRTLRLWSVREEDTYDADREVIRRLYKELVCNNEELDALLEEHSLYWNDDKEIVDSFVLKTIKRFDPANGADQPLLPDYDSDEDRQFAHTLFRATLQNASEYRSLIEKNTKNWEFSRLAFMDVVLMQVALAEILTFPSIPLNVTFNEYLDLAKVYSTPRSAAYINGMLDHIVKQLREEKKLLK